MSEATLFDSESVGISEAATDIHSGVTPRLVDPRPLRPLSPPLPDVPQGQGTAGTAYEEDSACQLLDAKTLQQVNEEMAAEAARRRQRL